MMMPDLEDFEFGWRLLCREAKLKFGNHLEGASRNSSSEESCIGLGELRKKIALLAVALNVFPPRFVHQIDPLVSRWREIDWGRVDERLKKLREVTRSYLRGTTRRLEDWPSDDSERQGQVTQARQGIDCFLEELRSKRRWTHLAPSIPGQLAQRIESGFEPPRVMAGYRRLPSSFGQLQSHARLRESIDLRTMVAQTVHEAILVGGPGSGKSTTIQWLAHQSATGQLEYFDRPIVVHLAEFAEILQKRPSCSLIEFFFQTLEFKSFDTRGAALGLRLLAAKEEGVLLLLDGWDEVPSRYREIVRERISFESDHMTTIVTSRPCGLPQSFGQDEKSDYFELANLCRTSLWSKLNLHQPNHAGAIAQFSAVGREQAEEDDFQDVKEPFWISQLAQIRQESSEAFQLDTARISHQMIQWTRTRSTGRASSPETLSFPSFRALSELAYRMVFDSRFPREWFSADELERIAVRQEVSIDSLFQSRFIRRVSTILDQYAFSYRWIRNGLAAAYWSENEDRLRRSEAFDLAMQSSQRFSILLLVARLYSSSSLVLRSHAERWSSKRALSDVIIVRLANLVAAADWSFGGQDLWVASIQERLVNALNRVTDVSCKRRLLHALSCVDDSAFHSIARLNIADTPEIKTECASEPVRIRSVDRVSGGDGQIERDTLAAIRIAMTPIKDPAFAKAIEEWRAHPAIDVTSLLWDVAFDPDVPVSHRLASLEAVSDAGIPESFVQKVISLLSLVDSDLLKPVLQMIAKGDLRADFKSSDLLESCDPGKSLVREKMIAILVSMESIASSKREKWRRKFRDAIFAAFQTGQYESWLLECFGRLSPNEQSLIIDSSLQEAILRHWDRVVRLSDSMASTGFEFAWQWMQTLPAEIKRVSLFDSILQLSSAKRESSLVNLVIEELLQCDPSAIFELLKMDERLENRLHEILLRRDWIWAEKKLIDSKGQVVVHMFEHPSERALLSTPDAIQEIALTLPPRQRSDLLSYWHMIAQGTSEYRLNNQETIYADLCTLMESETPTVLGERLASCYENGRPPAYSTWRKNLSRVVKRCETKPNWIAHLNNIGLGFDRRKQVSRRKPK